MANSLRLCVIFLFLSVGAKAVTLNIGKLSVADGPAPGTYVLLIENFTGDPGGGGTALPPDFPVFTALTLQNPLLDIIRNLAMETYGLPDVAPGSIDTLAALDPMDYSTPTPFVFVDPGDEVTGITLTATLDMLLIVDYLGQQYQIDSATLSIPMQLTPGNSFFVIGDMALIQVQATLFTPGVPEPATLWSAAFGCLGLLAWHRSRRKGLA